VSASLHVIRGDSLSPGTAQTPGMVRSAAISGDLVGAQALWMGRTVVLPGDYVWVPPHVPHREENPSPDTEAVVVIARSTQEAIVVSVPEL
jgi:uncharacterized RmlC-like cupin family protein